MSVELIRNRLAGYRCRTEQEHQQALREITQEIVLAALGRHEFFRSAVFQGGACLRIFFGLPRFSEGMDFLLRRLDPGFQLNRYLGHVSDELAAFGYGLEVVDRSQADNPVQKAFLKDSSLGKLLLVQSRNPSGPQPKIRIKLEVDTQPPAVCGVSLRHLDFPFVSGVVVQDFPGLFAGKIHAVLCRRHIKGRDWYDLLWYLGQGIGPDLVFLRAALHQSGPWSGQRLDLTQAWIVARLEEKMESLDWAGVVADVRRLVTDRDQASLELWGPDLFREQIRKLG